MEEDVNLLPRDILLRDTFTPAETILFITILVTANVSFWLVDPRSYWLMGFFLIAAGLTGFILKTHEHFHPFFVTFLWPKFWLCTAPVWMLLLQYSVGLLQDPFKTTSIGDESFLSLAPTSPWLPVSTASESTWPTLLGYAAIYLVAVNLFIVPKSRAFLERLLRWLCFSSVLVAIFGFFQSGLELSGPLLTKGTNQQDFFAFFPYDGHWAAFATIWTCINISMSLMVTRYDDSPPFIESKSPWYLTGGILMGSSAFLVEARWPAVVLMLTLSCMLLLFSLNFLKTAKDPHWRAISVLSGLASTAMFAAAVFTLFQDAPDQEVNESLHTTAMDLFKQNPLFGWGLDSFGNLLPFFGSDFLLGQNYERAGNDVAQLLAEIGIAGVVFPVLLLVGLLVRYLRGRCDIQLTNHILTGCAAIIVLAFYDTPLMSPAVCFSFFVALFIALRWADITRKKVDEVDAPRPTLVTPEAERRVPFYNQVPKNRFK